MKKVSPVLSLISVIAVAVLYVLHFSTTVTPSDVKSIKNDTASNTEPKIAYVYIDSIMANYDMNLDELATLKQNFNLSEAQFQADQRSFEKSYKDAEYKVQRGLVTRSEQVQLEQDLAQKQQGLLEKQQRLQMEFTEKQQVSYRNVLNSIMEYLEKMESSKKYDIILGTAFGDNILYTNKALNITDEVIEGLNADYQISKEKK